MPSTVAKPAAKDGALADRYRARISASLHTMRVDYCPAGRPPRLIQPGESRHRDRLLTASRVSDGASLPTPDAGIRSRELGEGDCVRYEVLLPEGGSSGARMEEGRVGEAVLAPPELWLWRDPDRQVPIRLSLELPPGIEASVPWPREEDGSYRISRTTFRYLGRVAFGPLRSVELPVAGGLLRVAHLGEPFEGGDALLHRALVRAAEAVAAPLGALPEAQIQVLLVGVEGTRVHFGATARGGGACIALLVGRGITEKTLRADWVIVHELTHLIHPHLRFQDAWFYEGLATYYGAVLRSRAGLISPDAAWAELQDGFRRGAASLTGRSLQQDSREMRKNRAYWRVYWSGAAVLLLTDLRLRRESGGLRSLDDLLLALWEACRRDPWSRPLDERLARIDPELSRPLREIMERSLRDPGFPELEAALRELGVSPETGLLSPSGLGRRLLLPGPHSRNLPGSTGEGGGEPAETPGHPR